MASQDFPLLSDPHAPTRLSQSAAESPVPTNTEFYAHPPLLTATAEDSEPERSGSASASGSKRNPYYYKKQKTGNNSNNEAGSDYRVDYRKDREEWSDTAIACLLEAYTEKFNQLNRGNLRGRDWEEVAEAVTERCGGGGYGGESGGSEKQHKAWKSVEQCKNKIDNLKKRYKVELQRMNNSGSVTSSWHWFKQMEVIVGSNNSSNLLSKSGGGSGGVGMVERNGGTGDETITPSIKQSKRYNIPGSVNITNNLKPKPQQSLKWRRVVFKISGSAFAGNHQNIDPKVVTQIAGEVATACRLGVEVAIVVGGRNFFCGDSWVSATALDRPTAYQVGVGPGYSTAQMLPYSCLNFFSCSSMMATVMNAVLLQSALEKTYIQTRVQSAIELPEVAEPYCRQRAIRHLEKGRVVIFGGVGAGSGNPLFTTDTAAALRASEINAEAVVKGTNVDSLYDSHSGNGNVPLQHLSYREALSGNFTSMDTMAVTYCEENRIPVVVFNLLEPGNISRALSGDPVGTLIDQTGRMG
ncbi:hypothetical protein Pint_05900 [Pistacia integerrima]|uniref:Uncharacterized protein n=1 Tax=Pistacia integerrima TaxID=434235 RepID=A0ACC0Z3J3_9ROSI|nr:hypothetical protein Pint_05900 [Pistacia integerrima]